MKTYIESNTHHVPASAVIGGEDYAKNITRVTPSGKSLWLSKGKSYRIGKDYSHKWSRGHEGPFFLKIPAGSTVSLHSAGSPVSCAIWKVELPKGKTIS